MKQRTPGIARESLACIDNGVFSIPSLDNLSWILQNCKKSCKKEARNTADVIRLRSYMCRTGLQSHAIHGNVVISMLIGAGKLSSAHHVYDQLPHSSTSAWNSLILAYVKYGKLQQALSLFHGMQQIPSVKISAFTLVSFCEMLCQIKKPRRWYPIAQESC